MNVLIVEDEFLLGQLVADTIVGIGKTAFGPAASQREALAIADANRIDLALVDIDLRGGDSGISVAAELQRRSVPSIFLTGQQDLARASRALAVGLLAKPYRPADVVEVIAWMETPAEARPGAVTAPRALEIFGRPAPPIEDALPAPRCREGAPTPEARSPD